MLALQRVGAIRQKFGELAAAETAFVQSVKQSTDLVLQYPDRPEFRVDLACGQLALAKIYRATGRTKQAHDEAERVNEGLTKLGTESFTDAKYRQRLAQALRRLCEQLTFAYRLPEAEAAVRSASKIWESLVKDFPADIEYRYGLAMNFFSQGVQRSWWSTKDEKAEARLSKLCKERPDDMRFRWGLAAALTNLGVVLSEMNRVAEVIEVKGRAVKLFEGLVADSPDVTDYQHCLGTALKNLAVDENRQGPSLEGMKHYRAALGVYQRLADRHPDVFEHELRLAETSRGMSRLLNDQGKGGEAREVLEQAASRAKKALKANPAQGALLDAVFGCSTQLASYWINLGDHAQAARIVEDLLPLLEAERDPRRPGFPDTYEKAFPGKVLLSAAVAEFRAARILLNCAALAERDAKLSATERKKAVQTYTEQAGVWLKASTRAPEDWVRDRVFQYEQVALVVAEMSEGVIDLMERERQEGLSPHAREAHMMKHSLLIKALIQKAMELAPEDPSQYQMADVLSSAPEGLRDPELALKLARRAVERTPGDPMCAQSLGWALYRSGDWKGCIEWLKKQTNQGESDFVLAMAHWQLGEKTEAKARFERGSEWLKDYEQRCEERRKQGRTTHPPPSMLKRFQAEAAALLGSAVKPPAGKEKTGKPTMNKE